jgi:hypothetical protein
MIPPAILDSEHVKRLFSLAIHNHNVDVTGATKAEAGGNR